MKSLNPKKLLTARICSLAAVIAVAAALRFWGLAWGLPERTDLHPDEDVYVMSHVFGLSLSHPDPQFLNYPSFVMYAIAIPNGILTKMGVVTQPWQTYLVGRAVVAVFGTLSCMAVFCLAEACGAVGIGAFLAALWTALLPLHVWESHVAVTDVVMTFWILVSLWGAVKLLRSDRLRYALVAGAAAGLAVASKYTAALVAIATLVAVLAHPLLPWRRRVHLLLAAGVAALVFCFIAAPFSFIRFPDLLAAMRYENAHVHGHHFGFSIPAAGPQYHRYIYQLMAAWPFSMGLVLYLSAVVGVGWAAARRTRALLPVLLFMLAFFALTGSWTFTPLRYYMPLVVLGALCAGIWQGDWWSGNVPWKRGIAATAVLSTLAYTAVFTVQTTRRYTDDTRMQAGRWLREHIQPDVCFAACGDTRYMSKLVGDDRFGSHRETLVNAIEQHSEVDLLEISSLLYARWYRHDIPSGKRAYERLRNGAAHYTCVKRFEATFINRHFYGKLDPMFEGYFLSPTLEFYARTDTAGGQRVIASLQSESHHTGVAALAR